MKIFHVLLEYARIIGIRPIEPGETSIFNFVNLIVLWYLGISTIAATAFLLFEASTFQQYAESFFAWISVVAVLIGSYFFIQNTLQSLEFIASLEKTIESRK